MSSVWNILKDIRNSGGDQAISMRIWNSRKEFKLEDMRVTSIEMVREAMGPQSSVTHFTTVNSLSVIWNALLSESVWMI